MEHRKKWTDVDTVLQHLSEKTEAFGRAISIARDQAIQRVGITTRYTAMRTTLAHHEITLVKHNITQNHKIVQDQIYSLKRNNAELKETIKAESRRTAQHFADMYDQNFKKVIAENEARAERERRKDEQVLVYKNEMMALVLESKSMAF